MFDDTDPRVTGDYVRRIAGSEGESDVIIVGVVHDHPASKYRVESIVESTAPDVLALELPPIAVPLFERYAGDGTPPTAGGEMSVAVRAATTDTVEGIDGPTLPFLGKLVRNIYGERMPPSTVRSVLSGLLSVTKHAVACRIAATIGARSLLRMAVDSAVTHECDDGDPPERQAADEATQIRRAKSIMNVFGKSNAVRLRDITREEHMADRLADLRTEGSVVAVVGADHLDSLTRQLQ